MKSSTYSILVGNQVPSAIILRDTFVNEKHPRLLEVPYTAKKGTGASKIKTDAAKRSPLQSTSVEELSDIFNVDYQES